MFLLLALIFFLHLAELNYMKETKNSCFLLIIFSGLTISCGFLTMGGGDGYSSLIQESSSAGEGNAPRLASRLAANSELEDKSCKEDDRCKETCRKVYYDINSHNKCYDLTFKQVSVIEEAHYTLLSADSKELKEELEAEELSAYLTVSLDGFLEKVINNSAYDSVKIETILQWIIDEEEIADVIEAEDQ